MTVDFLNSLLYQCLPGHDVSLVLEFNGVYVASNIGFFV